MRLDSCIGAFRFCLGIVAVLLSGACTTTKPSTPISLRQAVGDSSVAYFIRPSNDAVHRWDNPTLEVNGKPIGEMSFATYVALDLTPGSHLVSLKPGPTDSPDWQIGAEIRVDAGKTYYFVFWHQRQPARAPEWVVGLYGVAGHLIYQVLNPPSGKDSVQLEIITRDLAEYSVTGLREIRPSKESGVAR